MLSKMVNELCLVANEPSIKVYIVDTTAPPNAFALPNRKIFVYKSLIKAASSQNELAGVIAHENGHIIKHHSTIQVLRELSLSLLLKMTFGIEDKYALSGFLLNPYSQALEIEADNMAAEILANAKVDTSGLIAFFQKLEKEESLSPVLSQFLLTHPSSDTRIKNMKQLQAGKKSKRSILTQKEWESLIKSI